MASMDSLSSCEPQANCQPEPPIAQAPKPTRVMCKSELPSLRVCISISFKVPGKIPQHDQKTLPHLTKKHAAHCHVRTGRYSSRELLAALLSVALCRHMLLGLQGRFVNPLLVA